MRGHLEGLRNALRLDIHTAMAQYKRSRAGTVDQWDPEKHVAKVKFQPGDQLSGWLPVGTQFMGDEFGDAYGLSKDDQVIVTYQEGSLQTGMITHRLWSDKDKPVKDVKSGEHHKVGKHFQAIKMYSDDKERDDKLKKALLIRGYPGENKKDEDGDSARFLFDKDGNLVRTIEKGNSSETLKKGDRSWSLEKGNVLFDIQSGKGNVKHGDDFTFEPKSGKKVQVKGSGSPLRVMLEDGTPSKVLWATKS